MANGHGGRRQNAGSKKGQAKNPAIKLLREAIILAADKAGRAIEPGTKDGLVEYLTHHASATPTAFMGLLGKVLPMQVAGDPDDPVRVVHRIELVAPEYAQD